jgi:Tfp pilus assembly protein PilV
MAISKPLFKKILLGTLVLLLVAAAGIWYIFTERFTDTSERDSQYSVNAMDLIREFQQNDSLANKKYTEKIITVNGIISEVEPADTTLNIKFADTATGAYIIFAFQQQHLAETKKLKEGDAVSIKGSCSGGTYSSILETTFITFKRCALTK